LPQTAVLNWNMRLAFGTAILTLLAMCAVSYRSLIVSGQDDQWVQHTQAALENIKGLQLDLATMDAGRRAYLLTGDGPALEAYRASILMEQRDQKDLAGLTTDNPIQQRELAVLAALVAAKVQRFEPILALRQTEGLDAALVATKNNKSQDLTEQISASALKLQDEEQRLLGLRSTEVKQRLRQTKMSLFLGTLLALSITGLAVWLAHRDSLARGLAEEALRESEERFRLLLDGIRDYAIFMLDPGGTVVSWNAGAERIKGYTAEQIVGKNFAVFFSEGDIQSGKPQEGLRIAAAEGRYEEERISVRKDGTQFQANNTVTALRDPTGTLLGFSKVSRDITRRKESEEKYRGLLEAAPDAMVVVNREGEIVLLNVQAEKQFGYRRDELVGEKVTKIIPEGFAERLIADRTRTAAEALEQQIGTGLELNGLRRDGSEFPIEIMLSPLESIGGTLVTVAIRNITMRKDLERRVEERTKTIHDQWHVFDTTLSSVVDFAYTFDPEGRFLYANHGLLDLWGLSLEAVIGKTFFELPYTHELAERLHGQVAQVSATGQKFVGVTDYTSPLGVVGHYEYFFCPVLGLDGTVESVAGATLDITARKSAEAHLVQMEARYRGLLEAAPDAMVVVNQSGEIVLLNVQAEKQFGYSRDELIGQKVTNIIPKGFAERLIADETRTAAEALAQQIGTGIELNALRKDDSEFPIEIMLSPLESAEGILVTAAIRDISVRRAAEERYRGLLEAAPDAMVVVNQKGEIVLLNVQAEKQFGYSRDELIGQKVTNIIPEGFAERLIADGTRTAAEALAQQIGTGIELNALRKDGSGFPIEIMLSPLQSAEGILVTAAIRDISVRRAAEERYRGLLEAAPDAMVVVNESGEIVLLNVQAEKQFGYSRDELVGQKVKNIIPEGFAERLIADALRSTEDALAQQIGTGIELCGLRKDGSEFPIEIMLSPLKIANDILVTAAIRDINVRKKAEAHLLKSIEELSRSNEELEQFAYIASHDLQEPLRMVASYTQLLSRRYTGKLDSDADEFIAFAVDGANRMQRLIQDLLAYSRIGTQGKSLLFIPSEEALRQALINLGSTIQGSGALVTHGPLPVVAADEIQLVQLFQNLIGNAIKYQREAIPRVHISAVKDGTKKWMFSVQDNGLGIESRYFDKIFGMFQRLHRREEFAGTGIGLAICKKIVERHGGNISVESEPGQGSTFHFALAGNKQKS